MNVNGKWAKDPDNRKEIGLILLAFAVSRILTGLFGIHMKYDAIYVYWQYLNTETLQHHLLQGVWYDHAQPPCFNLLLGIILKIAGPAFAPTAFAALFKAFSLITTFLLYAILKHLIPNGRIPLLLSLLYLLSPGLIIFESELFYTTFISMLLLTSFFFLLRIQRSGSWTNIAGLCIPLVILCLTRSMYHIAWLAFIAALTLWYCRRSPVFKRLLTGFACAILLVTGWYAKNYAIFGQFSTSSWIGMNFARTVFFHADINDSSRIETIEPFSEIRFYKTFITPDAKRKYAGLDDRDLLQEMKNDSCINENHIDYLEISRKYMDASKRYVKAHPANYFKNVALSGIVFFAPATRYTFAEKEAPKIKYYDLVYSFNLNHFAKGLQQRRIALTISAIPKFMMYCAVCFLLLRAAWRQKKISLLNAAIFLTIAFVFVVSSLIEHYENMRFRFEIEPLFLVLLGQAIQLFIDSRKKLPKASI